MAKKKTTTKKTTKKKVTKKKVTKKKVTKKKVTKKKVTKKKVTKKKVTKKKVTKKATGDCSDTGKWEYQNHKKDLKKLASGDIAKTLPKLNKILSGIELTEQELRDLFSARLTTKIANLLDIRMWSILSELLRNSESLQKDFHIQIFKAVDNITTGPKKNEFLDQMLSSQIHPNLLQCMCNVIRKKECWDGRYLKQVDIGQRRFKSKPPLTVDGAKLIAAFNPTTILCRNREVAFTDEIVQALTENTKAESCELGAADLSQISNDSLSKLPGKRLTIHIPSVDGAIAKALAILKALASRNGHLTLADLGVLTADAARELTSIKGSLWIEGIKTVSDEVAEALSDFRGECLSLANVEHLSNYAASSLAKCRQLALGNLKNIEPGSGEPALIETLVKTGLNNWNRFYLQLEEISKNGAESIAANSRSLDIGLKNLKELTPDAAAVLAKCKGDLTVGCKTMTAETAEALAKHTKALILCRMTSLPAKLANALAEHRGPVEFTAIKSLTASSCLSLCKNTYGLSFHNYHGEISVDDGVIDALADYQGKLNLSSKIQSKVNAAKRKKLRG